MNSIERPELVAPAGDLEKLETAVRFGADAVYVGGGDFSLRAPSTAFTLAELKNGIRFAHEHSVKVYLALNIYAFDSDLEKMIDYYQEARRLGIDAVIVSDPGVISMINQLGGNTRIHLSTQANTTNSEAVKFWLNHGIKRIVLARELNIHQIGEIKEKVPGAELEIFAHGAMCVSYSGRCLLSKHMSNRSANRGDCSQPCRWEYDLREVNREERFTIEEDQQGTYILNSKDLCLIEHLPELINAGVGSFKIEGRMKTPYYVAAVTRVYRQAIDQYCADPNSYVVRPEWLDELAKVSHRPYGTGFYFSSAEELEYTGGSAYIRGYDFVGTVLEHDEHHQRILVAARNLFKQGDELEVLDPHDPQVKTLPVTWLKKENGEAIAEAHNQYHVFIPASAKISRYSILRRRR